MKTTEHSPFGDTARLIDLALDAVSRPEACPWEAIARLGGKPDAALHPNRRFRAAHGSSLRWAVVFVAANLGHTGVVPLLMEASVASHGTNEIEASAARIATEALVKLVDVNTPWAGGQQ